MNKYIYNGPREVNKVLRGTPSLGWKNEVWDIYNGPHHIYHKDKTFRNCWIEYGLMAEDRSYTGIVTTNVKYPTITDIKDLVEGAANLSVFLGTPIKQAEDASSMYEAVYQASQEIDFGVFGKFQYAPQNFVGSIWYTHAWDAKGVSFGNIGWERDWVFNIHPRDHFYADGSSQRVVNFHYLLAGSNIMKSHFRFHGDTIVSNAQGMFKGLQVHAQVSIEDGEGNPLVSTTNRGFCPHIMSEMFKQLAGNTIKDNGAWINWSNCHSAGQLLWDTWGVTEIASFGGHEPGTEVPGNVFIPGYPDSRGRFPRYNRENGGFLKNAFSLKYFGPVVDMMWQYADESMFDNPTLEVVYIKNLNNGDWEIKLPKLTQVCIDYLMDNAWDLAGKYEPYEGLDEANKEQLLLRTKTLKQNFSLIIPFEWYTKLDKERIKALVRKGWNKIDMRKSDGSLLPLLDPDMPYPNEFMDDKKMGSERYGV